MEVISKIQHQARLCGVKHYHRNGTLPKETSVDGRKVILVFGSNLQGIHGAGAANVAYLHYGAKLGVGEGLTGRSYAVPTRFKSGRYFFDIPMTTVEAHIRTLIEFMEEHDEYFFFLTAVGCGLANQKGSENKASLIASLFLPAPHNASYPDIWLKYMANSLNQRN